MNVMPVMGIQRYQRQNFTSNAAELAKGLEEAVSVPFEKVLSTEAERLQKGDRDAIVRVLKAAAGSLNVSNAVTDLQKSLPDGYSGVLSHIVDEYFWGSQFAGLRDIFGHFKSGVVNTDPSLYEKFPNMSGPDRSLTQKVAIGRGGQLTIIDERTCESSC